MKDGAPLSGERTDAKPPGRSTVMSLASHVEDAVVRLKEAQARIVEARAKPATSETTQEWLEALSDFALALADIQTFNNESVHEKLHELRGRFGLERLPR